MEQNPDSHSYITHDNLMEKTLTLFTDSKVLNIGSAGSSKSKRYQKLFPSGIIGIDINSKVKPEIVCDAMCMSICDSAISYVYCNALLEHVPKPHKVIDEIYRVLKPGGWAFLYVPFLFPYHRSPEDYYRFTAPGIAYLCRNFSNVLIQPSSDGYAGVILRFASGFIYPFDRMIARFLARPINLLIFHIYQLLRKIKGNPVNEKRLNAYLLEENTTGYNVLLCK